MKVLLVAMPWNPFDQPSAALGVLAAFVRGREGGIDVECRSEFLDVWRRIEDHYEQISGCSRLGELIYAAHLFPGHMDAIRQTILSDYGEDKNEPGRRRAWMQHAALNEDGLDHVHSATADHLEAACRSLSGSGEVVGLTTSFAQLFPSLCLAKRLKKEDPAVKIVLGGMGVPHNSRAFLRAFPFVDYVIRGEGEMRLLELLTGLRDGLADPDPSTGIISRANVELSCGAVFGHDGQQLADLEDLGELPIPDYDEYRERADQHDVLWTLPIEGSRGCWWDQRAKSGNPKRACFFCGLSGSSRYRDKPTERIAVEMEQLADRYEHTRFRFTDNLLRRGGRELAEALSVQDKDYRFFLEVRATTTTADILGLLEAGCGSVQIGVEGLSTSYLRRLNKGTTALQNLGAMRSCYELGLKSTSCLLVGFPGGSAREVEETHGNIVSYAIAYDPLIVSQYGLEPHSVVFQLPECFGVTNIRNDVAFQKILPPEVASDLLLPWLDFDTDDDPVDWTPAVVACDRWRELHERLRDDKAFPDIPKPLFYFDGGNFLEIIDRRNGFRTITLEKLYRDLYVYCMEIRSKGRILEHFRGRAFEETIVNAILAACLAENLMCEEDGKYLSLAVAWRPSVAKRRITQQHDEDQ